MSREEVYVRFVCANGAITLGITEETTFEDVKAAIRPLVVEKDPMGFVCERLYTNNPERDKDPFLGFILHKRVVVVWIGREAPRPAVLCDPE